MPRYEFPILCPGTYILGHRIASSQLCSTMRLPLSYELSSRRPRAIWKVPKAKGHPSAGDMFVLSVREFRTPGPWPGSLPRNCANQCDFFFCVILLRATHACNSKGSRSENKPLCMLSLFFLGISNYGPRIGDCPFRMRSRRPTPRLQFKGPRSEK